MPGVFAFGEHKPCNRSDQGSEFGSRGSFDMTLLSRLGYSPRKSKKQIVADTSISPGDISIVIPVKNNQPGIDSFLRTLEAKTEENSCPLEVVIVDNNSDVPVSIQGSCAFDARVVSCKDLGPAAARNFGVRESLGSWILFLDSDCIPTETTVSGYATKHTVHVGFAGTITSANSGHLSDYYDTKEILMAPEAIDSGNVRPDYLITANCLIYRAAFDQIGGFDVGFVRAGGEDIDIAFRLLEIGSLDYQFNSVVRHDYSEYLSSFVERFYRYGLGNRQLAVKYRLKLFPMPFLPEKITFRNCLLAFLQYVAMSVGYVVAIMRQERRN